MLLSERYPAPPAPDRTPLRDRRRPVVSARELYEQRWMFHGPRFAGVARVDALAADGIAGAVLALPARGALLDSVGQLIGHWMQVVPTVAQIREKFNARRGSSGRIEQTLRRILGIDLKMKQYAEGSRFVRTVVDEAGMETFNKVWTSPDTLPTKAEFADPQLWLDRVAGSSRPTKDLPPGQS